MSRGGKREGAGRPKGSRSAATKNEIANISELAKTHAGHAVNALAEIAKSGLSEAARVSAASAILDRAYGKPQAAVEVSGPNKGPIQHQGVNLSNLSDEELAQLESLTDKAADQPGVGEAE